MNKKIAIIALLSIFFVCVLATFVGCESTSYVFVQKKTLSRVAVSASTDTFVLCDRVSTDGVLQTDEDYQGQVALLTKGNKITFSVDLPVADALALQADYRVLHGGLSVCEAEVKINGEVVLQRTSLPTLWQNETNDFAKDSFGNEVTPSQVKIDKWNTVELCGYDRSTPLAPVFELLQGANTIEIEVISGGEFLLGDLAVKSVNMPISYEEYSRSVADKTAGDGVCLKEAEFFAEKDNTMAIPSASADVNVTGYDTYVSRLNVLSGLENSSQSVSYKINVKKSGLYNIAFNYKNSNANHTAFVKVTVDGVCPFEELLIYPLTQNSRFEQHVLGGETPFSVYLTQGTHLLTVKVDGSQTVEFAEMLQDVSSELNDIYLDLRKIAGTVQDGNREWDPDNDFPGVTERLQKIKETLQRVNDGLKEVNGSNVNYQGLVYVQTAEKSVSGLLDDPQDIPNNYALLAEGSGSIVQTVANAKNDVLSTPFSLDKIVVYPSGGDSGVVWHGEFFRFWEAVKKFFHSFVADYSVTTDDEKTIQVWVARPSQYVNLMQQIMDASDFTESTGYNVKFSVLADEGKLILSNAADISPNAVMGISNWLPYEMGIRDITVDLTQFDDYGKVISRFSEGAMISLIADGKGLALPETQDFYVMYYRKDILQKYGISLPDTWNDVVDILPKLQRYGLNFYIPLSSSTSSKSIMTTAPFIYQYGGTLFSSDATKTTIGEENSLNAIKLMTELYTLYGLPQQINNFFDSFRNGSLPIGVSTFDAYVRLSIAAPEIAGKWGIALSPGVYNNSTGKVERWQTGSATSMSLIKSGDSAKDAAGWELLKWWSSSEIQTDFMNKLTMLYGKSYIWNSANLQAFGNSIVFSDEDKATILEQWQWMREIPKLPGWYMLERELSNAWNKIVIDGENTRSVIENAVTSIDKELLRKLEEFGYVKNGKVVKQYVLTTPEYIRSLKQS